MYVFHWGGWVKVLYPRVGASEPRVHVQRHSFSYPFNYFLIGRDMLPSRAMNETQYKSISVLRIGWGFACAHECVRLRGPRWTLFSQVSSLKSRYQGLG